MNCWPSLQTVVFDGWILRYAEGLTKRSNCVIPLYHSSLPIETKIKFCENFYFSRNQPCIFKLTGMSKPEDLDRELDFRAYGRSEESIVMTLDMNQKWENLSSSLEFVSPEDWVFYYSKLNHFNKMGLLHRVLSASVARNFFGVIKFNGEVVACGLLAIQEKMGGIFQVVVDDTLRRRGFGKELLLGFIAKARTEKLRLLYLQVENRNMIAKNLYQKLGFRNEYKYWYRIAEE